MSRPRSEHFACHMAHVADVVNPVGSVYHVLGRGATWRDAVDDALAAPQQEQLAE